MESFNTSRGKLFSIIFMAACSYALPLHAGNSKSQAISHHRFSENNFVSTGYLYKQCKRDLKRAENSREKFSVTYCGAVFSGFLGGFVVSSFGQIESDAGATVKKKGSVKNKTICLPDELSPMKLASDFINFIDTAQYDVPKEKALAGSSFYGLQELYNIYHCK